VVAGLGFSPHALAGLDESGSGLTGLWDAAATWTRGPHGRGTGACTGISIPRRPECGSGQRRGQVGSGRSAGVEGARGAHVSRGVKVLCLLLVISDNI
jgi:hypothetical protein